MHSTIGSAGLQYWHVVNGAPWHGSDMLHHVHHGFSKLVPPSSKRAKHPLVTIEALTTLRLGLDLSNAFDASVWAVASIAFWSCCQHVPSSSLIPSLLLTHSLSPGWVSCSSLAKTSSIHQNMPHVAYFLLSALILLMVHNIPPSTSHGQRPQPRQVLTSQSQLAITSPVLSWHSSITLLPTSSFLAWHL